MYRKKTQRTFYFTTITIFLFILHRLLERYCYYGKWDKIQHNAFQMNSLFSTKFFYKCSARIRVHESDHKRNSLIFFSQAQASISFSFTASSQDLSLELSPLDNFATLAIQRCILTVHMFIFLTTFYILHSYLLIRLLEFIQLYWIQCCNAF